MIIGIDITSIPYGTGVSNYTLNLVSSLAKIDKTNIYKLFFSSLRLPLPPQIKKLTKSPNVRLYRYHLPISFFEFIWNRLHILPIELFIGKCDIFHTSDWTQPPTIWAKSITTVHDFVPLLFPQWLSQKIVSTHRRKLKLATKKCFHFICVSQNTLKDFHKIFPEIDAGKTSVVPEAAENKYGLFPKLSPKIRQQKINFIHRQYDLGTFLLAQGTREPRKNLDRLIQAFNLFKKKYPRSKLELAIAGKYGWGQDSIHLQNPSIKFLGFIPEKDMVSLHAAALCLVLPSLYEGFGLPLIKSMKVGVPVITSKTSSLGEIAANCGLLVDPESVPEILQAIEKTVKYPKLRRQLALKGKIEARKYSWQQSAAKTLRIYQSLC